METKGTSIADQSKLIARGYRVIPINGKGPTWKGWPQGVGKDRKRLEEVRAAHPDHENTGLLTGELVMADVDLRDPEHAEAVSETLQGVLGLSMFERIGSKGVGLFYHNRKPLRKIMVTGKPPGQDATATLVEIFGEGVQVAAFGIHPGTGKPYSWPRESLLDHDLSDLPEVTPALIREAVEAVMATLEGLGYTGLTSTGERSSDGGKPTGDPVTVAMLEAMLARIDPSCKRPAWIAIGGAIKSARVVLDNGDENPDFDAADLFVRWSSGELNSEHRPGNYEGPSDCDKNFDGLTAGREGGSGVGSIVHLAKAGGYTGPTFWSDLAVPKVSAIERLRGLNGATAPMASTVEDSEIPGDPEPEPRANRWPALIRLGADPSKIKAPVPIIPGYLLSRGVTALLAPRRAGKTIIALDVALSVASALPWAGEPIIGEWHSVYLCGEDAENTAAHIRVWCAEYSDGLLPERFYFIPDVPNLLTLENRDVAGLVEAVRAMVPEGARVVWIVDTWQRATTDGGQNDDADMKPAFRSLEALADSFHGAAIGCFHPPKDNARTISGVAFQENAAVAMWLIEKTDPENATSERKLTVANMKGRGEGNYKLFRFEESTVETVMVPQADSEPFELEVTGVRAHHIGGTGEDKETAIERVRKVTGKDREARDTVFAVVTGHLENGRRVLNHNNAKSSAVQLRDLTAALEGQITMEGTATAKGTLVRRHLDALTSKADGRLKYRETEKGGHVKASFYLPD